jgi:hypothetical protein
MERKRAYDRERMAQLHAKGETYWQQHPIRRDIYDSARWTLNWRRRANQRRATAADAWGVEIKPLAATTTPESCRKSYHLYVACNINANRGQK